MEKRYDSKAIEAKWYARWEDEGAFHGDAARGGEPFCVMIPPPNVTGILHMGHALNNTIQDILVRWRRMQGRNVLWMPGTDHAGIATQNVVERALKAEGKTREDLGREAFVARVWEWREQYGSTIIRQLKRLGCSCDWERQRFTMDEGLSRAVTEVFVRLYEQGLIYRAHYIINWCPRCRTALSDEESEHTDTQGKLYYIRYPVGGGGGGEYITVATTRPETLLGDVAVAVHPEDARYRDLAAREVTLPLLGRKLRVIQDTFVDPAFGTGVVKVTPAHDPNDFEMGRRHGLEPVNVMTDDGRMNDAAGPYAGLDRFACRRQIVADLEAQGLIERIDKHRHAVGHCYRCDTVVEPRLSPQWFVRMKPLATPAIEALTSGKLAFVPERWSKVYLDWMENIRDWCISRQIWWGHRIPVFTCRACAHQWAARAQPEGCPQCAGTVWSQEEDVLDTWFSSWLWPFSTLGWPDDNAELRFYYPTHDLATASEIIFFWVARMVMAGYAFMGDLPFRNVYIHGTVRDDSGRKMSKSLGNAIDPLTVIDTYSADALRFSLMMLTATGQDVYVSDEKFQIGRNFATKLWNAARFLLMRTEGVVRPVGDPAERLLEGLTDTGALSADDMHLLAALNRAVAGCTEALERYRFNDAALALYEFVWHEYCDWYVEYTRGVFEGGDAGARARVEAIMHHALAVSLKLLHPFMPFVTEEIWHQLGYGPESAFIMQASWPVAQGVAGLEARGIAAGQVEFVERKQALVRAGRSLRADFRIEPRRPVAFLIRPADAATEAALRAESAYLTRVLMAESLVIDCGLVAPRGAPASLSALGTVYLPLAGLLDVGAEVGRLGEQVAQLAKELERVDAKLGNEGFVAKAPEEVVEQQRARRRELAEKRQKLEAMLATLAEA